MKSIVKKAIIYSMVGMMQIGLGASVIEASSLHNEPVPVQHQYDRHDRDQDQVRHECEHNRHERERIENERHEREMRRHHNESRRHWRERQRQENERHEENMRRIAHGILDLILDR